jgi:uncharacterized protein YndB with AHSA1/START domain
MVGGLWSAVGGPWSFPHLSPNNKNDMQKPLIIRNEITIDAPASRVWDALVKPEQTKQYMFGCEALSDWNVGSELIWKGEYEGKEMIFVKGEVLEIEPEKLLRYTTIDPHSDINDVSENYLQVTYDLIPQGEKTLLKVSQGDYAAVADGERRYQDSYNNGEGWNPILVEIKKLVEAS